MTAQKKALIVYGIKRQIRKLAEECAELGSAALHYHDGETVEMRNALEEKIASVEIMCEQMRLHFGDGGIDRWRSKELQRLEKRLGIKASEFSPSGANGFPARKVAEPGEAREPKAARKPLAAKSRGSGDGRARPCWVDGERFDSVMAACQRFGHGLSAALVRGRAYKSHNVSYTPPAAADEGREEA